MITSKIHERGLDNFMDVTRALLIDDEQAKSNKDKFLTKSEKALRLLTQGNKLKRKRTRYNSKYYN